MATSKKDLKKFRHDIAALKKRGLIPKEIDARSAVPSKRLNRALDKYDAVLSGKASAVKLTPKGLKEYKAMGKPFEIARPGGGLPQRVLIPHEANERVTVTHGKVRVANPAGVTRTIIPVKFQDLESYLTSLKGQKIKLKKGEQLAFRFFDNKSLRTFPTMNSLINYLAHYETVFDAIEDNKHEAQMEIYQNLEIVKVEQSDAWKERGPKRDRYRRGESPYRQRRRRLKSGPAYKREDYNAQQAERQRDFRKRLGASEKELYKAAARKRAKKSKKAAKTAKRKKKK